MNTHENENENLRKIGKLLHAHGLRGELYLLVFSGDYNWFEVVVDIFLETNSQGKKIKGPLQSYKIQSYRPHKEGLLVTLAGVENRNQSEDLSGSEVWVSSEIFVTEQEDNEIFLVEIENFDVYDREQKVGRIVGFTYNGDHDLLIVEASSGESDNSTAIIEKFEIPFVEEFIEDIDYDEKKIIMHLPEGLIEVQLSQSKIPEKIDKETK